MSLPSIPTTTKEYFLPEVKGINALQIRERTVTPPKDDEVLVKIYAVSLQYRDLAIVTGNYALGQKDDLVPCSDCAGKVLAVGSSVTDFKPGDRVSSNFCTDHVHGDISHEIRQTGLGGPVDGVLTEVRVFKAYSLVHIPEHLSYEEASTLPCAAVTAYNALMGPSPLKGGDTVLVLGSGGVSVFALQIAKASGATVIATTSSEEKAASLRKLGADHVVNYSQNESWEDEVVNLTNGRGVDHVIEIGGAGTLPKSLKAVRYAGWIHVIGFLAKPDGEAANIAMLCLGKAVCVRGILVGSRTQFESLNRLITSVKLKPVIDAVFSFEDAKRAYERLESQKHVGKIVIRVATEEKGLGNSGFLKSRRLAKGRLRQRNDGF